MRKRPLVAVAATSALTLATRRRDRLGHDRRTEARRRRGSVLVIGAAQARQAFDPGMPMAASDAIGDSVAAGDIDGDHKADVAIGSSFETVRDADDAGGVTVLRGSARGLTTKGVQWITQNAKGFPGKADLTIGASGEDNGDGWLYLLRGTRTGVQIKGARNFGPPALGIGKRYARLGKWLLP
ncbi:FG-GAP repeat protein [Actinomadura barringtoniae]|uniref:FG-GAP repeat protein n=1 Tax=Actinomadura barringtoniae TaxID=1427535 RepID=A0A939PFH0_9ACTN|nr:FG-GAP repeat protein [Actinomadura barringtoniae]MBO2451710.1 FG-GAP repeat protein [Actinomadura barringtoniae]